jgi:acetylornithine/succinyldiaminopimelate/putrescine aminotransferase
MNAPAERAVAVAAAAASAGPMPHVMNTYGRLPIALSHGHGCWVWDTQGQALPGRPGGIAVNTLGHNHPKLVPALQDQVAKLIHSSNYYEVPLQEQLAAKLCELSGLTNVFFCNSGLEANEARSRSPASTVTTGHRAARDRRLREGVPRPLASPRCRPPATRRSRRASSRWSRASCACR